MLTVGFQPMPASIQRADALAELQACAVGDGGKPSGQPDKSHIQPFYLHLSTAVGKHVCRYYTLMLIKW